MFLDWLPNIRICQPTKQLHPILVRWIYECEIYITYTCYVMCLDLICEFWRLPCAPVDLSVRLDWHGSPPLEWGSWACIHIGYICAQVLRDATTLRAYASVSNYMRNTRLVYFICTFAEKRHVPRSYNMFDTWFSGHKVNLVQWCNSAGWVTWLTWLPALCVRSMSKCLYLFGKTGSSPNLGRKPILFCRIPVNIRNCFTFDIASVLLLRQSPLSS